GQLLDVLGAEAPRAAVLEGPQFSLAGQRLEVVRRHADNPGGFFECVIVLCHGLNSPPGRRGSGLGSMREDGKPAGSGGRASPYPPYILTVSILNPQSLNASVCSRCGISDQGARGTCGGGSAEESGEDCEPAGCGRRAYSTRTPSPGP